METTAPSYRATLSAYLAPLRGKVTLLALAMLGSIGLQLLVPQLLARFIDGAITGSAVSGLVAIGVAFLVAGVLNQGIDAVSSYLGADIGWAATNRLREDLGRHLLDLDMGYHNNSTPGEMIERVDGDVTAVSDFISRFLVRLLGAGVLLLGVLVICWFESEVMGIAITLYVFSVLALLWSMRNIPVRAAEEEREVSAVLYGFVEERLAGIEDIRALGAGRFTMARFVPVMRTFFEHTTAAWRKRVMVWVTANTVFWAGDAIALAVGTALVLSQSITVGTAYLILQYAQLVRRPIEQVTQELQQLQKAAGGIVRIDRVRKLTTQIETGSTVLGIGSAVGRVRGCLLRLRGPDRARSNQLPSRAGHSPRTAGPNRRRQDHHHQAHFSALSTHHRDCADRRGRSTHRRARIAAEGARGGDPGRSTLPGNGGREPDPFRTVV